MQSASANRPDTQTGRSASVRFILLTLVIDSLGFGLVVPITPSLVLQLSGMDVSGAANWVGLLVACFAAMQFFCAPILGGLSDRFGRRPVLLISLAGSCANYLLLAWAPSLTWLFLGRMIAGATAASASTATAYIADVTPPAKRAGQFGLVGAAFGVGFVVGPAVGGMLGTYGLDVPFLAAAALAGCNALYGLFVLPESLPAASRRPIDWRRANPLGSVQVVLTNGPLTRLALAWAAAWFALGALQTTFVLANQLRFGWDSSANGLALGYWGLGSALVQGVLVRRIVPRLGERRSAMIGASLAACGYMVMAVAPTPIFVFVAMTLQALAGITNPAIQGMVSASASADRQGETQGALSSIQGLTAIVAPVIGSLVFAFFTGPATPLMLPGAAFIGSALAYGLAVWAVSGVRVVRGPADITLGTQTD